jgi:hypothetical protein
MAGNNRCPDQWRETLLAARRQVRRNSLPVLPPATKLSIGVDHSGDYMPSHFSIYEPLLASVVRAVLGIRQTSADPHAFVLMGSE